MYEHTQIETELQFVPSGRQGTIFIMAHGKAFTQQPWLLCLAQHESFVLTLSTSLNVDV